ncbi:hypothetical protein PGT21_034870 [Puccinia graminis f. sp. tritici]|uniref:Secreted protein n=1 Tax=Puccinia graminis f. sp. tritici TaxID=56615 RepID=A0A5B0N637_PUCGR|nr:hypothetical protein PGTUg99_021065 [Puccinia graminis f. sp. tritici]KAA1084727.1 hypothetical protein PGT21_034870 [Puccinia graminis f. sp. tritici]
MHIKSVTAICCLASYALGMPMESKELAAGSKLGSASKGAKTNKPPEAEKCHDCGCVLTEEDTAPPPKEKIKGSKSTKSKPKKQIIKNWINS